MLLVFDMYLSFADLVLNSLFELSVSAMPPNSMVLHK